MGIEIMTVIIQTILFSSDIFEIDQNCHQNAEENIKCNPNSPINCLISTDTGFCVLCEYGYFYRAQIN